MSRNLQNFAKFQKFQLENLVDFEKCCKTRIFLQKSVPMQPKTSNILPKFAKISQNRRGPLLGRGGVQHRCGTSSPARSSSSRTSGRRGASERRHGLGRVRVSKIGKFCKFLAGSFSAVSKRNFARKYAFDSIFQALQDVHTFAPLRSQIFSKHSV